MRRRAEIWDAHKNNPSFKMYDVYHWEAHPDQAHPEPTTLEQRVKHYEDYLEKFPEVIWPGFVEEPSNPVSDLFGLEKGYWGDQTYLVLIDKYGKIAYQNSFPKGSNSITQVYNDIDALIPTLLEKESLEHTKKVTPQWSIHMQGNRLTIDVPASTTALQLIDMKGRIVQSHVLHSAQAIILQDIAKGIYVVQIETEKGLFSKEVVVR